MLYILVGIVLRVSLKKALAFSIAVGYEYRFTVQVPMRKFVEHTRISFALPYLTKFKYIL